MTTENVEFYGHLARRILFVMAAAGVYGAVLAAWRSVRADGNGCVAFRGFRGSYRISWADADGKSISRTVHVK